MVSKQEDRRKRIYNFYLKHRAKGKKYTVDHFKAENVPYNTVYRIIKSAENDSGHARVQGSGRIAKNMTRKRIKKLETFFNNKDGVSQRGAARKFKCSHQYIGKILNDKLGIHVHKKQKIPNRDEKQRAKIQDLCKSLYSQVRGKSCILESFFTFTHGTINGNDNFYSRDVATAPSNIKFSPTSKFEGKLLTWICISDKGISKPFFIKSGLAVNQEINLKDCIKKRLVPFIKAHHSDGKYIFWPDLASSHYANTVTDFLDEKNINYVKRKENPPNVPELRPIEDFWGILKGLVYADNWQATSHEQLKKRIQKCLKKVDPNLVKRLAKSTLSRFNNVRKNDIIENR